ncbi:MAG: hypothetical protein CL666_14505 [Balneola sp.]|nr:hypothetical protein [Balneola sp.]|tara:strand:- start:47557 stop:47841 length:285 start_codon:yes stop_codon:yes gene_type:complete
MLKDIPPKTALFLCVLLDKKNTLKKLRKKTQKKPCAHAHVRVVVVYSTLLYSTLLYSVLLCQHLKLLCQHKKLLCSHLTKNGKIAPQFYSMFKQ